MGVIEGAIIGGAIGVTVSLVMLAQRSGRRKKLIKALASPEGPEAARAQLDASIKPVTKIPLSKILDQRERMAGLAVVGAVEALEQELAGHDGALTSVVQVGALGLLGLALRKDPAEAAARLDALATRMEQEGGRAMALVKKKTRALAHLAAGVAGTPIPVDKLLTIEQLANDGGLVQLVVWQALSQAMRRAGKLPQAEGFANKVRQHTRAFENLNTAATETATAAGEAGDTAATDAKASDGADHV